MSQGRMLLSSRRVVTDSGVGPATIAVDHGTITEVRPGADPRADLALGDLVVMPGLIDAHVHVNEPGRTEWEGFATASRAAAAGGITTIVVMPLNCFPAATSVAALESEARSAAASSLVDFGLWGGLVAGNESQIEPMWHAGALGFKCFMAPSGIDDFPQVGRADLERAMPILARLGAPLLVHAEDPDVLESATTAAGLKTDPRSYSRYVASRPPEAETVAISALVELSRRFGVHIHVVHVATLEALPILRAARREGLRMTAETCPHYLTFCSEEIPDGATLFKCAPPIRGRRERTGLAAALVDGTLQMVASDHSPCPPGLKRLDSGDFSLAWGGIAGLQLVLPATWRPFRARGPASLARWLSEFPSTLAGLAHRKGRIAEGFDADLVAWDPDATFTVDQRTLEHRHKLTPYHGHVFPGVVRMTIRRGRVIFDASASGDSRFPDGDLGQWLKRTPPNPASPS